MVTAHMVSWMRETRSFKREGAGRMLWTEARLHGERWAVVVCDLRGATTGDSFRTGGEPSCRSALPVRAFRTASRAIVAAV